MNPQKDLYFVAFLLSNFMGGTFMKNRKRMFTLLLVTCFFILFNVRVKAEDYEKRENILIIHSYNQGFSWTDELHRGITDKLPTTEYNLYTEYLDSYRVETIPDHKLELIKSYANKDISCIVVTDNPAYDLMISLKEEYFSDIPILFAGVNGGSDEIKTEDVKGILQNVSYDEYLKWINDTFPEINNLLVCGAKTKTTKGTYHQIMEAYEKIDPKDIHYKIVLIEVSDYHEQIKMITSYDAKTTAVYVAGSFGVLNHDQYTDMLSTNSNMPTFCGVSTSINHNVLGGYVVSPYEHGGYIGDDILQLSTGTDIDDIPIIEEPIQQIIFNYRGMKLFGLSESDLPANSKIINKPDSQIVLTFNQVLMLIVFILFLFFVISALFVIATIRKRANETLKTLNEELDGSRFELMQNNTKITHLLEYDQLTQLMNDTKFFEEVAKKYQNDQEVSLISIVITNLNNLTLSHGKELYQAILITISDVLKEIISEEDFLGITSNHEFLIVTKGNLDTEAYIVQEIVKCFDTPLIADMYTVILKYKLGIAHYPKQGKNFELLQNHCDIAITSVFDDSLKNAVLYNEVILNSLQQENSIRNEIEVALLKHEFVMYYQPKYAKDGLEILGFEALIRWKYSDGTIKSPAYFIDIAEQSGQILKIGLYVMEEVCKTIVEFGLVEKNIPVAINLSGHHFASKDIVTKLSEVVEKYKVPPHFLELEITETTLIKNKAYGASVLKELQDLGFTITLDDFGTGYASINYIKDLPINKIKIDQVFVQKIQDLKAQNLLGIMIQMANELSLEVTIEGIETQEQFQIVTKFNPDELQGYLFKRPLPLEEIIKRNK